MSLRVEQRGDLAHLKLFLLTMFSNSLTLQTIAIIVAPAC
jgi:hypothetical protein